MIRALKPLRKIALRALSWLDFNVDVEHHWVPGRSLNLHVYRHRGYWFQGKQRERKSIERCRQIIKAGDTVVEVGAHVGYLTVLYASLVGPKGRVIAFEPGPNNLPYLRRNTSGLDNVTIVEAAVAKTPGRAKFFIENLTGQNNTLVKDYAGFEHNREAAASRETYRQIDVDVVSLDSYFSGRDPVDFVKIDTEGAEAEVIEGAGRTIARCRPAMMIELSGGAKAFELLCDLNYLVSKPGGDPVKTADQITVNQNFFFEPVAEQPIAHLSRAVH